MSPLPFPSSLPVPFNPPRRARGGKSAAHSLCICITARGRGRLTGRTHAATENLRLVLTAQALGCIWFSCSPLRPWSEVRARSGREGEGGRVRRYLLRLSSFLTPLSCFGAWGLRTVMSNPGKVVRLFWSWAGTGLLKLAQVKGILTVRNQVQGIIL